MVSLDPVLKTKDAATELIAVETIPDTNLAVLIFANGKTLVLDKKQKQVVQRLKDIRPGTTGVTYISARQQLLLAGTEGIYLYQLSQI